MSKGITSQHTLPPVQTICFCSITHLEILVKQKYHIDYDLLEKKPIIVLMCTEVQTVTYYNHLF